ncbi:hypothetical protein D6855_08370 [Butyrivibrio sp. CB08]|uniref:DUF3329 domain-containing protein n=1 Tax=Butyrivibrio sp. CB08 TaxID=2364879 RepID=UPI000EA98E38|nr:DUF6056 family protein [Butyrivibrio sp. CB08]RKM59793.1 hypothetical protein D6855_08370 [Butyrivibrio sp. CB08]
MTDKLRKKLFYAVVIVNYIMITIYQFLTPNMSDDIMYADAVAKANSFMDLFVQEYEHYLEHTGRNIAHIILRIFLYIGNKGVFNIVAGIVFMLLSLFVYQCIDHKIKYDIRLYIGVLILLWTFDPAISNNVLWETGACNYLFTATIIFGYITLFRKAYKEDRAATPGFIAGMFFLGVLSGWCNENTSGGVIFFVLLLMLLKWLPKKNFSGFRAFMVSGLIGNLIGYGILLSSPGNSSRAASAEEAHTGMLALAARFLRVTLILKEHYLVLILIFIVIAIAIAYRAGSKERFIEASSSMMIFGLAFLATSYALVAVPDSQLRTYYGASLFLMTGIANGFAWIVNDGFKEDLVQILATALLTVLSVLFLFSYIENGANLARIKREFDERDAYLTEMAKGEEMVIEAPMLRPDWDNRYTMAYKSDICEDKFNWLNLGYAEHYGLWYIIGVDRETWMGY